MHACVLHDSRPADSSVDEQAQAQVHQQQQQDLRVQPGQQAGAAFRAADGGGAGAAAETASTAKDVPRRRLHWGCSRPGVSSPGCTDTLCGPGHGIEVHVQCAGAGGSPSSSCQSGCRCCVLSAVASLATFRSCACTPCHTPLPCNTPPCKSPASFRTPSRHPHPPRPPAPTPAKHCWAARHPSQ